jgi:hypothetical protein
MDFETRIAGWEALSRWERSELGKDLRRSGLSYGEIMELVPVKKSTLATWCRDVKLNEEQWEAMVLRRPPVPGVPRNTQRKRHREIELIQAQAALEAEHLQDDPVWSMGVALYWAEGSKTSRRLELAHSEPEALRLFMIWARRFHASGATFAAAVNLHADNDEPGARRFWSEELQVPLESFTKSFVKPDGTGHRKNHLATGVCRLRMRQSTDAFLRTMAWIEFIKACIGDTITEGR